MLLLAAFLYGDDDEDDKVEDIWDSIVQSIPIIGVGGSIIYNVAMGTWGLAAHGVGEAWDRFHDAIKTGVPKEFHPLIEEAAKQVEDM